MKRTTQPRDFRFAPVHNPAPRLLTPAQIEAYNTQGHIAPFRLWCNQSIWCRGSDPTGHWVNIPRPTGEDTSPADWQLIGAN